LSAYTTYASGTATANATVEVYSTGTPDATGSGEGRTYLGTTIATGGAWSIGLTLTAGTTLTATATDTNRNTSMFSINAVVTGGGGGSFEVINTNDSGAGSLRQAMLNANAIAGSHTITFNIPTDDPGYTTEAGVSFWKIKPTSALPGVTRDATVIDGTTQTTNQGNTNTLGPEVMLDGTLESGAASGISLEARYCTVEGLVICNFDAFAGVCVNGASAEVKGNYLGTNAAGTAAAANKYGVYLASSASRSKVGGGGGGENNVISGNTLSGISINCNTCEVYANYIGLNAAGTAAVGNFYGISVNLSTRDNKIGSSESGKRNVISGNTSYGMYLFGTINCEVKGNYIGLNAAGTAALANSCGIHMASSTSRNKIGGGLTGEGNVISGNTNDGVYLYGPSHEVYGNYTGLNAAGTAAVPNNGAGISGNLYQYSKIGGSESGKRNVISGNAGGGITFGSASHHNEMQGNYVGTAADGITPIGNGTNGGGAHIISGYSNLIGPGNVIACNDGVGVSVQGDANAYSNTITQNSIYDNAGLGITLIGTSNQSVPPPVITSADATSVTGTAASGATVEVFSTGTPDATGSGEGRTYLGTTIATGGAWSIGLTLTAGTTLTATATDTNANTSMFSINAVVTGGGGGSFEVINTDDSGTGSLRQAILNANAIPGSHTITFNIPTDDPNYVEDYPYPGVSFWVIYPEGDLPYLMRDATVIYGTSQAANQGETNPDGPEIMIYGDGSTSLGLTIGGAQSCTIEGLSIGACLLGIYIVGGSSNEVLGNYIGTEPTGTEWWGNDYGIGIEGSSGNRIGNGTAAGRNVISGNNYLGMYLWEAASNEVKGNYIGTSADGLTSLGNNDGIYIESGFGNKIGDGTAAGRNVISGNYNDGIYVLGSSGNEVKGNYIGTTATGEGALGNGGESWGGVELDQSSYYTLIGPGNIIAYNSAYGVTVHGGEYTVNNTITQNSLHDNFYEGIYLDELANNGIEAPVIATATTAGLTGTATLGATVEVFATGDPDSSGYGEGRTYLGTTIATGGAWSIGLTLTGGTTVTATATDVDGSTSMFSINATVEVVPTTEVTNTNDSGAGSLRQVMTDVIGGSTTGKTITFNIPTTEAGYTTEAGVSFWRIQPTSAPLPSVTRDAVVIDGTTQTTNQGNTNTLGPEVMIDGSLAGEGANGISIEASYCTIEGLVICNFSDYNMAGIFIDGGSSNEVKGNYIGTNAPGTAAAANCTGVYISSGTYNRIGGLTGEGNVISGNDGANYMAGGIAIFLGGSNEVKGNYIGVAADGVTALGNATNDGGGGVIIDSSSFNRIGPENVIAYNGYVWYVAGVTVWGDEGTVSNTITRNSIHDNEWWGIYLDGTSNQSIQPPVIATATTAGLTGTATAGATVEVFATGTPDATGAGQGRTYLGTTIATGGAWSIGLTLTVGTTLTATATDTNRNTSMFSINATVEAGPTTEVTNTSDSGNGSLRQVMTDVIAGTVAGTTITFNIPTTEAGYTTEAGVSFWKIKPASRLPSITRNGVVIAGTTQTTNRGNTNTLGPEVMLDGTLESTPVHGISIEANYCTVEGLVICNFYFTGSARGGIYINGGSNEVLGNYLGTDAKGTTSAANNYGLRINGSRNRIGNGTVAGRNVISGNVNYGVYLASGSTSNEVKGNYIGTNADGTGKVANGEGVYLATSSFNKIGGGLTGEGNVISGNNSAIYIAADARTNEVTGNCIGLNAAGTGSVPNSVGVYIFGSNNKIGSSESGKRNVISGNNNVGVYLTGSGAVRNYVMGNYIGTNADGTGAVPNSNQGVYILSGASYNRVGGDLAGEGNVISRNGQYGVLINNSNTNEVKNNKIGVDATGSSALGNRYDGVYIASSSFNLVGPNNIIAYNGDTGPASHRYGVQISGDASAANTVTRNSIYDNQSLGIYLAGTANQSVAPPVIDTARLTGLTGTAPAGATVEVFLTGSPDPTGSGEGRTYLGTTIATGGAWSFGYSLTAGTTVTATATDTNRNTSMFSINKNVLLGAPSTTILF
ncbi:MAG: right-handed parallel beta-helix repeat-containing protein, partial [Candidatus Saganbacteria bacterium]|nr:right-handed parallel beta-helix repeat-containing protein [Candidatus Saganbacteria bacterium]